MGNLLGKGKKTAPKEPQLIVVFGATGAQGGAVVKALREDANFKIRAVTRNADSEKSKALSEAGIEVITASFDDEESLKKAVEGAYGVFAVTTFWDSMDGEKELQQGKHIGDACKAENVQHVVLSSLENGKEILGKECVLLDTKFAIEEYAKSLGLPMTPVCYSFYFENLLTSMKPQKQEDDTYILNLPMEGKPIDMISVAETGECIKQIFKHPKKYIGHNLSLCAQRATIPEHAETLNKHFEGKTFKAGEVTTEQFSQLEFPGAELLAGLFEFFQEPKAARDIKLTKSLNPKISDFDTWVTNNKDALSAALE